MRISNAVFKQALALLLLSSSVSAAPLSIERKDPIFGLPSFSSLFGTKSNIVVLFNNAIHQNDNGSSMRLRAQVFDGPGDNKVLLKLLQPALDLFGIKVNKNNEGTLQDRTSLFFAKPGQGKSVSVQVAGCSKPVTAKSDLTGKIDEFVDLGECNSAYAQKVSATVEGGSDVTGNAFASGPTGFGIISDIDDTIKITNVLDKKAAAQAEFLDDFIVVPGMPELYAKLQTDLQAPITTYLSGSPNQLFPALQPFLAQNFPEGPVLTKDLAFQNVAQIVDSFSEGGTQDFKVGEIDTINQQFPQKNFVCIGDSTEKDPEAYAEAFRKHGGDFIQCIWIRQVDGADNSVDRFNKAFKGVPKSKFKLFKDPKELMDIDVANGKCN